MRPAARVIVEFPYAPPAPPPPAESAGSDDRTVLDVVARGETGMIVELDPPRGLNMTKVIEGARQMHELGVHLISMAENPLARVRMGNVAAALLVRQLTGIEPLVHFTCRDRNLIGLQSDILGAAALGLRNILAITGDPASLGGHAGASNVYDVRSAGLVEIIRTLNEGKTMTGRRMDRGTRFAIGVAFNPNVKKMEVQIRRLEKKIEAGAQFALTQPVFEPDRIAEMYEKTASLGIPVFLGVLPPASARNAEFLHNEVPGINIPEELRLRLRRAPEDGQAEVGEDIACELLDSAHGLAPGYYVIPPFTRYETAARLVKHVKRGEGGPEQPDGMAL
jgi:homocysteine S-methyltransferase